MYKWQKIERDILSSKELAIAKALINEANPEGKIYCVLSKLAKYLRVDRSQLWHYIKSLENWGILTWKEDKYCGVIELDPIFIK